MMVPSHALSFGLWFDRPLLLFLLFFILIFVRVPRSHERGRFLLIVRSLAFMFLVLGLSGVRASWLTSRQHLVILWDRSQSVADESVSASESVQAIRDSLGDAAVSVVEFGMSPVLGELPPSASLGTDIEAAIRYGLAIVPVDYVTSMLLMSDGNETKGDALRFFPGQRTIHAKPLGDRNRIDAVLSDMRVPSIVRHGEPFDIGIQIQSSRAMEATLEVYRGFEKVYSDAVQLAEGENLLTRSLAIEEGHSETVRVRVRAQNDVSSANDEMSTVVIAKGRPSVLIAVSDRRDSKDLKRALQGQGIDVQVEDPMAIPSSVSALESFDAVIIANVPASAWSEDHQGALRDYVSQSGGGLLMLGGDKSFGLGGYSKTTIESILPVQCDPDDQGRKPSLAMMLVIDKSGSMGGEKMDLAKEASKAAVELLGPDDQVGVIAFDGEPVWVSPIRSSRDKEEVIAQIAKVRPGGGTSLYPALEQAHLALNRAVSMLKHVIVLTDGRSTPGEFESIVRRMAASRITVSTVALGASADRSLLRELAVFGAGRSYATDEASEVPQIFAKETMEASRSILRDEPSLFRRIHPTSALDGIDFELAPFLLGHVRTRSKATSETIGVTENGEPLLVWWRSGLGMSAAFMSDASSRWGAEWLRWESFGPFWAQIVRRIARSPESDDVELSVDMNEEGIVLRVDAFGEDAKRNATTMVSVFDSAGGELKAALLESHPGHYEAELPLSHPGSYRLSVRQELAGETVFQAQRGFRFGGSKEQRSVVPNETLLREIAQRTRGIYDPELSELAAAQSRRVKRTQPLALYLFLAAAGFWILDIAIRRH